MTLRVDQYDALVILGVGCFCVAGWIIHPSVGLAVLGWFLFTAGRGKSSRKGGDN